MSEKKRSEVADVDRSLYDFTKSEEGYERYDDGLTPEIVRAISEKKEEPEVDAPDEVVGPLGNLSPAPDGYQLGTLLLQVWI